MGDSYGPLHLLAECHAQEKGSSAPTALGTSNVREHYNLTGNNHDPNCRFQRNCSKLDILPRQNVRMGTMRNGNAITKDLVIDMLCLIPEK